jgi:hypothetical protein
MAVVLADGLGTAANDVSQVGVLVYVSEPLMGQQVIRHPKPFLMVRVKAYVPWIYFQPRQGIGSDDFFNHQPKQIFQIGGIFGEVYPAAQFVKNRLL